MNNRFQYIQYEFPKQYVAYFVGEENE